MKHKLRKGLAVGVICLFMLVVIPTTSGDYIEYPEENGPYLVFVRGRSNSGGGAIPAWMHFGPFMWLIPPFSVNYKFWDGTIFKINNMDQDIEYPADIYFKGLKGFAPRDPLFLFKALIQGKITVFGICNEINIYYD